ncbi:hypothetical protein Ancab_006087 [Ancistrocladus abbreviatus]
MVGSVGDVVAWVRPSSFAGLPAGSQSYGRSDGVGLQGSLPPSSPREDHRPLCLPATGGIQGPTSKLLKRAKRNHGMSVKRGKHNRRHYRKLANSHALPVVLNYAIELGIFDIISELSREAGDLSAANIATHLPTENPKAASVLDPMLHLLSTFSLLSCGKSLSRRDGS